jgi:hypothetical protein
MKRLLFIALATLTLTAYGQDKYSHVHFNKLTEVAGTEYVIASIENRSKMLKAGSKYLLFINTKTGETHQVDFPDDAGIEALEQIKIDSLGINLIVVSARTIDLDGKGGIDWDDPTQIIVLSADGKQKTQLTDNRFFVEKRTFNSSTGTLTVAGYYDTNNNNRHDRTDKNEIYVYDLKTFRLISKI